MVKTPILRKNKSTSDKSMKKKVTFADNVDSANKENKYTKMAKLASDKKNKKAKRLDNGSKFQKEVSAKHKLKVKASKEAKKASKSGFGQVLSKLTGKSKTSKGKPDEDKERKPKTKKRKHNQSEDGGSPAKKQKFSNKKESESEEKVDWKKFKQEKKDLRNKRRAKGVQGKEVYEMSVRAKKLWEELRTEKCQGAQKEVLAKELYNLIRGKVKQVIFAHDTCRVVECLVGVSSVEIKQGLFQELKDSIIELSKSKYAHFFVLKLLRCGTKEQKQYVLDKLHGHVAELMKHKIAADVVECAYNDWANAKQRARMTQEFYGPEFILFTDKLYGSLSEVLTARPEKKDMILANMKAEIEKVINKGNLNQSIMHTLLADFLLHASEKDKTDLIGILREKLVHLVHTRDGARVAMRCLWFGTHKDRKVIIKSLKTHVQKIATDEYGHMVLLAAFDCVDDTILVSKAIFGELLTDVMSVINNEYSRKVLLYLVAPRETAYFHPHVIDILKEGDSNTMSKKESSLRQAELRKAAIDPIMLAINENAKDFVWNSSKVIVLTAVLLHGAADDDVTQLVYDKIVSIVLKPEEGMSLVEDPAGHLLLKKLVQHDAKRKENESTVLFSEMLLNSATDSQVKTWVRCNRGSFMVLSMIESKVPDVVDLAREKLQAVLKTLRKQEHKGAQLLMKKLG